MARLPQIVGLENTVAPLFAVKELRLPAGCSDVSDNTDSLAAYTQNTGRPYPSSVFGILDLATGRYRTVLAKPVAWERSFDAFTPMLSDSWIAWEEVSPGEANAARDAEWRLFAAPIDRDRLAIGATVLIDEGSTDYKPRPLYGLIDSSIYWTVNTTPSPRQEYVEPSGRVMSLDLATGARRTLFSGPKPLVALRTTAENVVIVEAPDDSSDAQSYTALVLDGRSGDVMLRQDLSTAQRPAHFPDYASGWLVWAAFPVAGAEWPDLYFSRPSQEIALAGLASIDPVFFGRYLAFESVVASRSPGGGPLRQARQIWGIDTARPTERFLLLETNGPEGWWQTTRAGRTTNTLVLWNDLGPWLEDQSAAHTLVRVYRGR